MLQPASLFTDGAVLCRDREIRIFGRAESGKTVTVQLRDARGSVLAEESGTSRNGRFEIPLPPQRAQAGCTLTVSTEGERVTAEDVAVGDVYLAGGQSNMELELRNSAGGAGQVRDDPLLRFFNVPRKAFVCEEQQRAVRETRWNPVNRETAGYNSAVASIFGQIVRTRHPEIPVGIIGCYWGGTSVTCWMDDETLGSLSEGIRYRQAYQALCGGKTMEQYLAEEAAFNAYCEDWNTKADAYRAGHPDAGWEEVQETVGRFEWNPPAGPGSPYRPAGLADSMLAEIAPVSLTAVLFYQGEEDASRTDCYDVLMTAMIRYWRSIFRNAELPFLFVQLPMWLDNGAEDTFQWPKTRLAQAAVRDSVRNTGMICLLDEGEYGNIHPVNKQPVGIRLAELAERMIYHGTGEVSPHAVGRFVRGNTMIVVMSAKVRTKDGEAPRLLEIAGEDGRFVPAEGEVEEGVLRIRAEQVKHPAAVRYAWCDWSDRVNLTGENGLPLEPFAL